MSIRPIDPLVMNNIPHAEKIAGARAAQDENAQAQSAMAMHKKIEEEPNKITALNEAVSQNKINKEPDKEKQKNGQQQNKKKKDENEEGSIIDIKI